MQPFQEHLVSLIWHHFQENSLLKLIHKLLLKIIHKLILQLTLKFIPKILLKLRNFEEV